MNPRGNNNNNNNNIRPQTVHQLQFEIETLKARIGADRERVKAVILNSILGWKLMKVDDNISGATCISHILKQDRHLHQIAEQQNVMSIEQLNIKIRKSLKGHNAKVMVDHH